MTGTGVEPWRHEHIFGMNAQRPGERRTRWVVALTSVMMVVEIAGGLAFGSMALLADGWHMATHAAALGVAAFAYAYARRHAEDPRYSFGTGKVGALGGFASAVGLAVVAALVLIESVARLVTPAPIAFDEAIAVAVLGLAVNLASAFLLREDEHDPVLGHHPHDHERAPEHRQESDHAPGHEHETEPPPGHGLGHRLGHAGNHEHHAHHAHHRDHNLRGAYLHVLADALTSILAIGALTAGKFLGWTFMDAVTGILGSIVIARWSWGLLRDTGSVLLDAEFSPARRRSVVQALEADEDSRVADLHVWRVGPRHLAAIVSVVATRPRAPQDYKERLRPFADLAHVTIEVQPRAQGCGSGDPATDGSAR